MQKAAVRQEIPQAKLRKNIWISCHKRVILICKEAININMKGTNSPIENG